MKPSDYREVSLVALEKSLHKARTYHKLATRFALLGHYATAERLLRQAFTRLRTVELRLSRIQERTDT